MRVSSRTFSSSVNSVNEGLRGGSGAGGASSNKLLSFFGVTGMVSCPPASSSRSGKGAPGQARGHLLRRGGVTARLTATYRPITTPNW